MPKEIIGNKKKLTWWQDEFWKHMVKRYPDLERGESASQTGRDHIPTRVYKEAVHLNRMREQIMQIMADTNPLTKKVKTAELEELLGKFIPRAESFKSRIKKYDSVYKQLKSEIAQLEKERDANKESVKRRLELADKLNELEDLRQTVEHIPPQILDLYAKKSHAGKDLIGEEL